MQQTKLSHKSKQFTLNCDRRINNSILRGCYIFDKMSKSQITSGLIKEI